MTTHLGYAIVVKGDSRICYTSAPKILKAGTIWQIYTNEKDAKKFLKIKFSDAQYEIIPVRIDKVAGILSIKH